MHKKILLSILLIITQPLYAMEGVPEEGIEFADTPQEIIYLLPRDMWVEIVHNIWIDILHEDVQFLHYPLKQNKFVCVLASLRATCKNICNHFSAGFISTMLKQVLWQEKLNGYLITVVTYNDAGVIWLQALLNAGADKNAQSPGATPLALAAYNGHKSFVDVLLEAGADPKIGEIIAGKMPAETACALAQMYEQFTKNGNPEEYEENKVKSERYYAIATMIENWPDSKK